MTTALLSLRDVTVRFGGVCALDRLSFDAANGELLGLIGPNGAGKTTAMRVITGVVRPQSGSVTFAGRDLGPLPTHRRVRAGLSFSQQIVRPFVGMTVLENVALAAGHGQTRSPWRALLRTGRAAERAEALALLRLVGIGDAADAAPRELPLGYLKRLEMARALALKPKLLLLDEPLAGLNSAEAHRLADTVAGLVDTGLAVVMIEHNLTEVLRVCARLVVLDNGIPIGEGPPREVMTDDRVRAAYLGEGRAAA